MNEQFDLLIDSYLLNDIGIAPLFLTPELSAGLQQNIIQLQQDNLMTPAGIGNDKQKHINNNIRTDKIYWLDKKHDNVFEKEFLQHAENFIEHLNRSCYTGINAYEFHYAVYEQGSFYKPHKDQFKNNSNRKFSHISYLNDNWEVKDGGQLQIYKNEIIQQIIPHSRTAVLFKSDEIEHEVIVANRQRMSITGWLKTL